MHPSVPAAASPLRGWRARAWAWVLFAALLKGLIPHAALASVVMQGDPALIWCAPGASNAAAESLGAGAVAGHDCVCAAASDGGLLRADVAGLTGTAPRQSKLKGDRLAVIERRLLPPPARGPPTL